MVLLLKNFHIVDEVSGFWGSVIAEDGIITRIFAGDGADSFGARADMVIDGGGNGETRGLVLMPAFVDLHAHFREPAFAETGASGILKETLESASLAAAAGGYGTVVCMANTEPAIDTFEKARALQTRCEALGLIGLFPVLSLTKGLEGNELSEITRVFSETDILNTVRIFSEDGKDVADDEIFSAALDCARAAGIPVSCHCDLGGENTAVERAIRLGRRAGVRLHIAHVSTKEAVELIRKEKAALNENGFTLSCEAAPHHLALTGEDTGVLGGFGKVSPPLRSEEDRRAIAGALLDGVIDAIATDHAPHTRADKEQGAPGFSGLETAFAVCYSTLVLSNPASGLSKLSSLMSAAPARLLGLGAVQTARAAPRGLIALGYRADLCAADLSEEWTVQPERFRSKGKNSPFAGKRLRGRIVLTIHNGRVVFDRR